MSDYETNIKDNEGIQFSSKLKVKVSYFRLTFKMLKERREENNKLFTKAVKTIFNFGNLQKNNYFLPHDYYSD
jgi:hypothetical protein